MKIYIVYREWVYDEWETRHAIEVFIDEGKARKEFEDIKQIIKSCWENREDVATDVIDNQTEYSCWYNGNYLYHHEMVRFEENKII